MLPLAIAQPTEWVLVERVVLAGVELDGVRYCARACCDRNEEGDCRSVFPTRCHLAQVCLRKQRRVSKSAHAPGFKIVWISYGAGHTASKVWTMFTFVTQVLLPQGSPVPSQVNPT